MNFLILSGAICSAIGQVALGTGKIVSVSGERIFTLSAIKRTPHIITRFALSSAAFLLRKKLSPVTSAISIISGS